MSSSNDPSLASLLSFEQRQDLSAVIATATEQMRSSILRGFETQSTASQQSNPAGRTPESAQGLPSKGQAESQNALTSDHSIVSNVEFHKLQSASLAYFDTWRDKVLRRVNEVLTSESQSSKSKDHSHAQKVADAASGQGTSPSDKKIDDAILRVYPPIPTPIADISHGERLTILNALFLMLLSLESYTAHSRTLLLRITSCLHIHISELTKMEKDVAVGLLNAASHMDASSSTQAAQQANASSRKWKVGLASVAGAALIGITGGLAAPLVAAGVGGLMGGLGLGATAAAGYLGTLAGSGVLVGSLFGAYGGRMTGKMMDEYAKEVEDFAFLPLNEDQDLGQDRYTRLVEHFRPRKQDRKDGEDAKESGKELRRLRVTIGISGWLLDKVDVISPWDVLGDGGEPFALRWEMQALLDLGNAIQGAAKSMAFSYIKVELLKQTVLAGLMAAAWPLSFLKFSKVLDNPYSIAKARADKAGAILADALINKAQGERPVSLIGYSLGARVILMCLKSLAKRNAFGLIDSVVVIGSPMPSDAEDWKLLRSVVSGRLVNVYSENDYILGFLYRTSSIQFGVAGLQPVEGVHGVENVDVSNSVTGHLKYRHMIGQLLGEEVGWADLDESAIQKEREAMKADDEEEKRQEEEAKRQQQQQNPGDRDGDEKEEKANKQADEDVEKLRAQLGSKMEVGGKTHTQEGNTG